MGLFGWIHVDSKLLLVAESIDDSTALLLRVIKFKIESSYSFLGSNILHMRRTP
jgi:hypothetical protein